MSTPLATIADDRLTVSSDLLGPLAVNANDIMRIPGGLHGFPECRAFVLLPAAREGLVWLQSTDYSTLSFLLADPFRWFPDCHIDLVHADMTRPRTNDPQHLLDPRDRDHARCGRRAMHGQPARPAPVQHA